MSPYRIHHTHSSSRGLRQLPVHAQRLIENALAAVAREAVGGGTSADDEQVLFAGSIQLAGAWVSFAMDHDTRVVDVLTVEPDADAQTYRPLSVAA